MAVRLLTGNFGTLIPHWAVNDFEAMTVGPTTTLYGETEAGSCSFGVAVFGTVGS